MQHKDRENQGSTEITMSSNHNHGVIGRPGGSGSAQRRAPEWANGLKQLYDSVVEEDLPDSFRDLLDQLDGQDLFPGSNDNGPACPDEQGTRR